MNYKELVDEISEMVKTMSGMSENERRNYYDKLVAANIIPFDINCSLAQDILAFGYMGNGKNISKLAQFTGEPLKIGKHVVVPTGIIGEVVGDDHRRIVLKTELGYLGWIDPEEFRILNVQVLNEFDTLH